VRKVNARALIALLVLPAAALVLAGCQIGGPPPPEAYERLGNAICSKNTEDLATIATELSDPDLGAQEKGAVRKAVLKLYKNELAALKQLQPPEAVTNRVDSMYAAYSEIIRNLEGRRSRSGESMTLVEASTDLNSKLRSLTLTDCVREPEAAFPGTDIIE